MMSLPLLLLWCCLVSRQCYCHHYSDQRRVDLQGTDNNEQGCTVRRSCRLYMGYSKGLSAVLRIRLLVNYGM